MFWLPEQTASLSPGTSRGDSSCVEFRWVHEAGGRWSASVFCTITYMQLCGIQPVNQQLMSLNINKSSNSLTVTGRLATANISHVSNRVTRIYVHGQRRGWPCTLFLSSSLIVTQNFVAVSQGHMQSTPRRVSICRGVAWNLLRGGGQNGVWGRKPQQGPGAEPRWGSGGEAPRSWRHILNA